MKKFFLILLLIFIGENAIIFFPKIKDFILQKEESRVVRGWRLAENLGCFSCHGGAINPGGKGEDKYIPSFNKENLEEHLTDKKELKEIKEIILNGQKKEENKKESEHSSFFKKLLSPSIVYAHSHHKEITSKHNESFKNREDDQEVNSKENKKNISKAKTKKQEVKKLNKKEAETKTESKEEKDKEGIIKMPGYKAYLSSKDLQDLIAFLKATANVSNPRGEKEKKGRDLVLKNSCFFCHGILGAGGIKNPGSLKGYIPSFIGNDFKVLVRSDKDLVEWIKTGKVSHIYQHPIGKIFLKKQIIKMPAYKNILTDEEIKLMVTYIKWLREEGKKYQ